VTSVSHDAINDEKRGLIYSTRVKMDKANINVDGTPVSLSPGMAVSVEIKNSGQREGDEVVQLYLRDLISSVTTYEKVLRGFERVRLKAGEKRTLTFSLARQDMELIDRHNQRTVEPGEFVVELGSSSTDIRQTAKFQIAP
jgi:beta-glucosidase